MINGIWENKYVQELGIFDHCVEIIELKNKIRTLKPVKDTNHTFSATCHLTEEGLKKEMMDLYLILEKWAADKTELKFERENKFEIKTKSN